MAKSVLCRESTTQLHFLTQEPVSYLIHTSIHTATALKCFYTVKGASKHFIDSFIPSKEIRLIVHVGLFIIMTNITHKQNIVLAQLQSFDPRWPRKHAWQGAHIMVLRKQEE